jgi:hypothetical protein
MHSLKTSCFRGNVYIRFYSFSHFKSNVQQVWPFILHVAITVCIWRTRYCKGKSELNCTNMQRTSSDFGKSWSVPLSLKTTLGSDDGVLVGPGRGLQLRSTAHGNAGRLLFCGHKPDPTSGRVSPIWASDDHGKTYEVKASLPSESTCA